MGLPDRRLPAGCPGEHDANQIIEAATAARSGRPRGRRSRASGRPRSCAPAPRPAVSMAALGSRWTGSPSSSTTSPSTSTVRTARSAAWKTKERSGSRAGCISGWARSTSTMSAAMPGASTPMSSRPSAAAPPMVAASKAPAVSRLADVLAHQPAGDDGQPHLLDQIVRRAVGAEPDIDAARAVAADMVHGEAIAGEGLRAMRHRGAGLGDQVEVLRRVPADLRMVVEQDAVRQHRCRASSGRCAAAHWMGVMLWRRIISRTSTTDWQMWVENGRARSRRHAGGRRRTARASPCRSAPGKTIASSRPELCASASSITRLGLLEARPGPRPRPISR